MIEVPTVHYDEKRHELQLLLPELRMPHWINICKEVGGKYDDVYRRWVFPPWVIYYNWLRESFPDTTIEAKIWREVFHDIAHPEKFLDRVSGPKEFFKLQSEGFDFLTQNTHPGAILALSPGSGKTAVSLVASKARGYNRVLIVAPLSLLHVWEDEAIRWVSQGIERCHGEGPVGEWVVTNYETISNKLPLYLKERWDLIIIDESIMVKSRKTQRYKALETLRRRTTRIWLLSGYPVSKYVDDLWAQLHLIAPTTFSSYWRFTNRYCYIEETVWGNKIVGTRADRNVAADLEDVLFIRNLDDYVDLPEYITQTIRLDMKPEARKVYDDLESSFLAELEDGELVTANAVVAQLTKLQMITSNLATVGGANSSAKSDAIVEMIESNAVAFPCLIWVHWKDTGRLLTERIRKSGRGVGYIHGENTADHEAIFETYRMGGIEILVCSMGVGKYGHTLTNTRTIFYHDITWDADSYNQSKLRVRRIGLKKAARLITLRTPNSTDELVEMNLAGKMPSIAAVSNQDLAKLLRELH